jgi:subtilisin family serine protease
MRYCFDNGARIISMSLGSSGLDPSIDEAGKELTQKGAWIFCAAGNSGPNTPDVDFPGRLPWAISVAAVDNSLSVANFSSSGKKIDTAGPGVNILSAKPGGGYQTMSGTSMSTPYVAGLMTCYRGALVKKGLPLPSTAELRKMLIERSIDIGQPCRRESRVRRFS